jgi:hypothetical protein
MAERVVRGGAMEKEKRLHYKPRRRREREMAKGVADGLQEPACAREGMTASDVEHVYVQRTSNFESLAD